MASRPFPAVPFIINSQASPIPVTDLDSNYAQLLTDFNDSAIGYVNYAADIGTANAYVLNLASAPSAYVSGMSVAFVPQNSNGAGASTLNVNSLGGVNITDAQAGTPQPGMIKAGMIVIAVYDGVQFRIVTLTELFLDMGAMPTTTTVNCAGYKKVWLAGNMTGANRTISLTNLNLNVDVSIWINNPANHLYVTATAPNTTAYTVYGNYSGDGNAGASFGSRVILSNTGGAGDQGGANYYQYRGVSLTQGGTYYLPMIAASGA